MTQPSLLSLLLLFCLLITGCTSSPVPPTNPPPPVPPVVNPTMDTFVADYFNTMPAVNQIYPAVAPSDQASGPVHTENVQFGDTEFSCRRTPYSMTRSPKAFLIPKESSLLWPGGLLQGASLIGGLSELRSLNIPERAPLTLVTNFSNPRSVSRKVAAPSLETVQAAVTDLFTQAKKDNATLSANTLWQKDSVVSTTVRSSLLGSNFTARFLPSDMQGVLEDQTKIDSLTEQTIFAFYLDKPVTISVERPALPADFFTPALTKAKLEARLKGGEIARNNPTAYVSSVTYGQFVMIAFTASGTLTQLQGILEVVLNGGKAIADLSSAQQQAWRSSRMSVYAYGGPRRDFKGILDSKDLSSFTGVASVDELRPVEYKITSLVDGSEVMLNEAADYVRKECSSGEPPPDPAFFSAALGNLGVNLAWSAVPEADEYQLDRKAENGQYSFVVRVSAIQRSYSDLSALSLDTAYNYRLRAFRNGAPSPGKEAAILTPPPNPSDFNATPNGDPNTNAGTNLVQLIWEPVPGASGYRLEYHSPADANNAYNTLVTLGANTANYTHSGNFRDGDHLYRLITLKGTRESNGVTRGFSLTDPNNCGPNSAPNVLRRPPCI